MTIQGQLGESEECVEIIKRYQKHETNIDGGILVSIQMVDRFLLQNPRLFQGS